MHFASLAAALALALALIPTSAPAQLFRTYLAIDGNDANPCTLAAPCRLLPAALAAVASGGEVWMLDSANYNTGTVSVAKSVTIVSVPGVLGSVVASGGPALTVSSGNVTLRNLNVRPMPGNEHQTGLLAFTTGRLAIDACTFSGFGNEGAGAWLTGATPFTVTDSTFRLNTSGLILHDGASGSVSGSHFSGFSTGLAVAATGTSLTEVHVSRTVFGKAAYGISASVNTATARARVNVVDSVFQSTSVGIDAYGAPGSTVRVAISGNLFSGNGTGVLAAGAGTRVIASGNTVTNNENGFIQVTSSTFESTGTNTVRHNTNDVMGIVTPAGTL